jgi:UDP-N-acetylglucosamine--N-acetylmuramyl-(pentapeptide) pyrophosphoryl-undecaprenol N-acetylglucosamine transferase
VVGFGGFVTGPGGVAAWLTRRPLMIHEQNAIAGYSNRMLARWRAACSRHFPTPFPRGRRAGGRQPVRADIVLQPPPAERFARREGALRLLILGGKPRRVAPQHGGARSPSNSRASSCAVRHQAGRARHRRGARRVRRGGASLPTSRPFIKDMAQAYADADLVICRAGALTISELSRGGCGLHPGAVSCRGRRSPDRQCAVPGARRSRRC